MKPPFLKKLELAGFIVVGIMMLIVLVFIPAPVIPADDSQALYVVERIANDGKTEEYFHWVDASTHGLIPDLEPDWTKDIHAAQVFGTEAEAKMHAGDFPGSMTMRMKGVFR